MLRVKVKATELHTTSQEFLQEQLAAYAPSEPCQLTNCAAGAAGAAAVLQHIAAHASN
jgi:hypothetical protein